MKRILLILVLTLGLTLGAQAQRFIGYDGPCAVYYQPSYGYYEYCDGYPFYLGQVWGNWQWRYGWYGNSWYPGSSRYDYRRRWQGHGRNWHNQQWQHNQPRHQQNWNGGGMRWGGAHPRGGHAQGGHPRGGHPHGGHPHGH